MRRAYALQTVVCAVWDLDDGQRLFLDDARKWGRVRLSPDWRAATADLGVEALGPSLDAAALHAITRGRRRGLKATLLDQALIAGLGNIYTDEALFRAGLHPALPAGDLDETRARCLANAIQDVLEEAIEMNGTSIDWIYPGGQMQDYLRVYGRTGKPCHRCTTPIERLVVAQRGTHVCPACQRL